MIVHDDLGEPVRIRSSPTRIVSLVPSLTESVASVRPDALVGATDWCTHPEDLDVTRVRGTKNPDVPLIVELAPDLVLANKEENRRVDVERMRAAGVPVWVTDIETLDQALESLGRLFTRALSWPEPSWLDAARDSWHERAPELGRVAIPIWRDPWMVVGSRTFTGDLARRLGLTNVYAADPQRYPHTTVEQIRAARPDLVLLPDEPYRFTATDGPECFEGLNPVLVPGRLLTWYGPSLAAARAELLRVITEP